MVEMPEMTADIELQKFKCKQAGETTYFRCRDACFRALRSNPPQWFKAETIETHFQCRQRNEVPQC